MNKNLKKVISSTVALSLSASAFLAFAGVSASAATSYPDVTSDTAYATAINNLTALGIVSGDDAGNFNPDATLKRSEAAKMIVEAFSNAGDPGQQATQFTDVPADHWASGYINAGVSAGYINGYGDGTFGPDDTLTYAQVVKLILGAMGYTSEADVSGGWPAGWLSIASSTEINSGVTGLTQDAQVTRAQVAQLIDNALDTPMYVYNGTTTNVWGQSQPNYVKQDGTGTYYVSPLINYHDTYAVEGRVIATSKSDSGLDANQVIFSVEYSRRFDDLYFKKNEDYGTAQQYQMVVGDTDAANYMLTYAEAYVTENNDGEWEIVAFNPSGRNVETTFRAEDIETDNRNYSGYNSLGDAIAGEGRIYIDTPSKATYNLNKNDNDETAVTVFVNGVEVSNSNAIATLTTMLDTNPVGEVTLIDTPSSTGSTTDGRYDYIMIDYYMDAVLSSVSQGADSVRLNFDDFQQVGDIRLRSTLTLSEDEDIMNYSITMADGTAVAAEDLTEGDVLSIYYDVVNYPADASSSRFVDIVVSRDTVEGRVTTRDTESSVTYYTIDGNEYAASYGMGDELNVGDSYVLKLNAAGRFVSTDESASSNLTGFVDRVWVDSNEEQRVKIITADGTVVNYIPRNDDVYAAAEDLCYDADNNKYNLEERIVTYKVNSSGNLTSIEAADRVSVITGEYSANTNRIGSTRLSETANVIDISEAYQEMGPQNSTSYASSDITSSGVSMFEDGATYTVLVANRSNTDSTYRFVLVLDGTTGIMLDSPLAVVVSTGEGTYGEDTLAFAKVVTAGDATNDDGTTDLYFSDDYSISDINMVKGDVFTYTLDGDGTINNFHKVFDAVDASRYDRQMFEDYAVDADVAADQTDDEWLEYMTVPTVEDGVETFLPGIDLPAKWHSSVLNSDKYVRIAFGPIVDRTTNSVDIARIVDSGNDGADRYYTSLDDIFTLAYAPDVNVYTIDYSMSSSERIAKGAAGSVLKTNIVSNAQDENDTIYWNRTDEGGAYYISEINYAFAKMVDGEVTDIYVVLPDFA